MHARSRLQSLIFFCYLFFVLVNGFQKPDLGLKPLSNRSSMRPVEVKLCMCTKMNGRQLFLLALVFFQCVCNFGLYLGLCLGVKELDAHVKKLDQQAAIISLKQEKSNVFHKDKKFILF